MKEILKKLLTHYGSHTSVANALGYSDRQYRNIRQQVERGGELPPRVSLWIMANFSLLKKT